MTSLPSDFYMEFHETLEQMVAQSLKDWKDSWIALGPFDLYRPLLNYIWGRSLRHRDSYNAARLQGMSVDKAIEPAKLPHFNTINLISGHAFATDNHPWHDILSRYGGRTIFFCVGRRNLEYMRPIIECFKDGALIWTDVDPDHMEWFHEATVLPYALTQQFSCFNNFLATFFPDFFVFAHAILLTLSLLKPNKIVCIDGCQTQYMIAAEYARVASIPFFCIQQGWPSYLHQGFKNWPYSHFLSWADGYSRIFKSKNPHTKFITCGYPYEVEPVDLDDDRWGVGFFLQGRHFIGSLQSERIIDEAISYVATAFPKLRIFIRRHPLASDRDLNMHRAKNIVIADEMVLKDVYAHCRVVVSQFSSCIMEGVIHGCVPLVLNPAAHSRYVPDVESLGIGYIAGDIPSFMLKFEKALHHKRKIYPEWQCEYGHQAADKMASEIAMTATASGGGDTSRGRI